MNIIDNFLNSITMYRLVLYYLLLLVVAAIIYSLTGIIHLNPFSLLFSTIVLIVATSVSNYIFAKLFKATVNFESSYITALILALIISPISNFSGVLDLVAVSTIAMLAKYILTIKKKHIFNPAALAVFVTSISIGLSASWWVGTLPMLPFELLGFLIVRKIRKYDLVFYFFLASLATIFAFSIASGYQLMTVLRETLFYTPIFFLAFVMLTEPLTTPPTKKLQAIYGAIVGILFAPQIHIGSFYTTPEIALVISNIYSYFVSPKTKIVAPLIEKKQI